ncbi:MAG TPA: hypothetical protein VE907_14190 [Gammaproteobacteria bacterium]|nr:hypothetical protein [Gammaproteobacteria bacterium]
MSNPTLDQILGRPLQTITKIDAARRQLATAIELWFADGHEVSTYTLAYASHEIIHALHKKHGLGDLLYDSDAIKPELRKVGEADQYHPIGSSTLRKNGAGTTVSR